jgi:hypothetical protein
VTVADAASQRRRVVASTGVRRAVRRISSRIRNAWGSVSSRSLRASAMCGVHSRGRVNAASVSPSSSPTIVCSNPCRSSSANDGTTERASTRRSPDPKRTGSPSIRGIGRVTTELSWSRVIGGIEARTSRVMWGRLLGDVCAAMLESPASANACHSARICASVAGSRSSSRLTAEGRSDCMSPVCVMLRRLVVAFASRR